MARRPWLAMLISGYSVVQGEDYGGESCSILVWMLLEVDCVLVCPGKEGIGASTLRELF